MKWGKAFSLGVKFFLLSAAFTIIGTVLITSAISISLTNEGIGKYVVVVDTSKLFESVGTLTLLIMGLMTLIVGNAASFFKLLSEAMRENNSADYFW